MLDLGRTLMAGAGGVGGSVAFLLGLLRARGHVRVVDHDHVDISNLNRTLPFLAQDAETGAAKVDVVRPHLEHAGLTVDAHAELLSTYYDGHPRAPGDTTLVLALANEHGAYARIQHAYPPHVLHATTTENWAVNSGYHAPIDDPCVACRFPPTVAPAVRCDTSVDPTPDGRYKRVGSLPFLAPLAASLLLRDLARHALGAPRVGNVSTLSTRSPTPRIRNAPLAKVAGCTCAHQHRDVHAAFLQRPVS